MVGNLCASDSRCMQLEDGWNSQGFVIGGVLDGAVEKWLKSHKGIDSKATCCHAICSTGTGIDRKSVV